MTDSGGGLDREPAGGNAANRDESAGAVGVASASQNSPSTASPVNHGETPRVALLGNPNTGKTTLFNRLCGLRARTGNFPGITVEARFGSLKQSGQKLDIVDLPGVYALALELPESQLCQEVLAGKQPPAPSVAMVVVDARNLRRNLVLAGEVLRSNLPTIIALNMIDLVERDGLIIDSAELERRLGCTVVPICARSGQGLDQLQEALLAPRVPQPSEPLPDHPADFPRWAEGVVAAAVQAPVEKPASARRTDRWDSFVMHPWLGVLSFATVMTALFASIFYLAAWPMELIESSFASLSHWVSGLFTDGGAVRDLIVDGMLTGIEGTVIFVPQIFLLFFLISLLEDTGYLARAAFVVDRVTRDFGLPGQAFVPLLSSHACAIPGILCTRLIPDRRDRLATILVAPFMSCSARLPVYALLISFLFSHDPLLAALAFAGCYTLGIVAALFSALLARKTFLRGTSRPMMLELPTYKMPSLRTATVTALDRSWVFLRKAGTVILGICIVMWWLSAYPVTETPIEATTLRAEAQALENANSERAEQLVQAAEFLESKAQLASSFAGSIGKTVEPIFAPLGYDWRLSIAVMTSFLAREVFVSSLAVIVGRDEEDQEGILLALESARKDDGRPVLTTSTAASLLVFYVLAMQCLPTLAVTRREAGGWKWALLQLVYMTVLAYIGAFLTRAILAALGVDA